MEELYYLIDDLANYAIRERPEFAKFRSYDVCGMGPPHRAIGVKFWE